MTKVIQQALQSSSDLSGMWMQFIQLHFNQSFPVEDQAPWDGQHILDEPGCAEAGKWPVGEHPVRNPSQGVVCHVRQKDKRLLGCGSPFAPLAEL